MSFRLDFKQIQFVVRQNILASRTSLTIWSMALLASPYQSLSWWWLQYSLSKTSDSSPRSPSLAPICSASDFRRPDHLTLLGQGFLRITKLPMPYQNPRTLANICKDSCGTDTSLPACAISYYNINVQYLALIYFLLNLRFCAWGSFVILNNPWPRLGVTRSLMSEHLDSGVSISAVWGVFIYPEKSLKIFILQSCCVTSWHVYSHHLHFLTTSFSQSLTRSWNVSIKPQLIKH